MANMISFGKEFHRESSLLISFFNLSGIQSHIREFGEAWWCDVAWAALPLTALRFLCYDFPIWKGQSSRLASYRNLLDLPHLLSEQ